MAGATWNPLRLATNIVLSNSNRTATKNATGGTYGHFGGTQPKTTGKWAYRARATVNNNGQMLGVCAGATDGAFPLTAFWTADSPRFTDAITWYNADGTVCYNFNGSGGGVGTVGSSQNGDLSSSSPAQYIHICVNLDASPPTFSVAKGGTIFYTRNLPAGRTWTPFGLCVFETAATIDAGEGGDVLPIGLTSLGYSQWTDAPPPPPLYIFRYDADDGVHPHRLVEAIRLYEGATGADKLVLLDTNGKFHKDFMPSLSDYGAQPLDATLTAFAGLSGVADRLPYFTGADAFALATFTAFARTVIDDNDAAAARATLALVLGTNVQAYDADLAALAALTSAADRLPYFTGSGTAAVTVFSAFARLVLDDVDGAAMLNTMGGAKTSGGNSFSGTQIFNGEFFLLGNTVGTSNLIGGTYTPTATVISNVTGTPTVYEARYSRVQNVVTVSGAIDIDPTSAGVTCEVQLTLPVASNFANGVQCTGTFGCPTDPTRAGSVFSNASTDKAVIQFTPTDVANRTCTFIFSYSVV
jgi:hypothetical protein